MPYFYVFDSTSRLIRAVHQQDDPPQCASTEEVLPSDEFIDVLKTNRGIVTNEGMLQLIPLPPTPASTWDGRQWVTPEVAYEAAVAEAQATREAMFAPTSWYVERFVETGAPIPPDVSAFRQKLRAITSQAGYPFAIDWPDPPQ